MIMKTTIFLIALMLLIGCGNPAGPDTDRTVMYLVSGTCYRADITYTNATGITSLEYVFPFSLRWSLTIQAEVSDWVDLRAIPIRNGSVLASISVDGIEMVCGSGSEDAYCGLFID